MTSGQSRAMSFVEAITNVGVGFLVAVLTQITLFPMLELQVSVRDNLLIGAIFTAVSIVRTFIRVHSAKRSVAPCNHS